MSKTFKYQLLSLLLIICIFSTSSLLVFANEYDNKQFIYLTKEDVSTYIEEADSSELVNIDGLNVKYYYGENYTVVEEKNGYALVVFNDDKSSIFVNGREVESVVVYEKPISSSSFGTMSSAWTYFGTKARYYNIVSLVPSVVGSLIGGLAGAKVSQLIVGTLGGLLVGGMFPEYYITTLTQEWFRIIDPFLELVEWRSDICLSWT